MLHQYHPQRGRLWRGRLVGTLAVGTILYIQDGVRPFGGMRGPVVLRNPWQIIAWLNREFHPALPGKPTTYLAGGHLAVVRSLRDGRVQRVADWLLLACVDAGLEVDCRRLQGAMPCWKR